MFCLLFFCDVVYYFWDVYTPIPEQLGADIITRTNYMTKQCILYVIISTCVLSQCLIRDTGYRIVKDLLDFILVCISCTNQKWHHQGHRFDISQFSHVNIERGNRRGHFSL